MALTPKQQSYKTYILSPAWAAKRQEFLASLPKPKCHWCCRMQARGFHVHHATYERFGAEALSDLRLMCKPCHKLLHEVHKLEPDMDLLKLTDKYAGGKVLPINAHPKLKTLWWTASMQRRKEEIYLAKLRKAKKRKNA